MTKKASRNREVITTTNHSLNTKPENSSRLSITFGWCSKNRRMVIPCPGITVKNLPTTNCFLSKKAFTWSGALNLPITVKQVKGHEYLYFSYYDREERRKREVYMGSKKSLRAIRKALQYNREFLDLQQSQIGVKYRRIDKYVNLLGSEAVEDDKRIILGSAES